MKKDTPKASEKKPTDKKASFERREALIRLLIAIVCGVLLAIWSYLAGAFAVFNWLYALFCGRRNRWVAEMNEYYAVAVYQSFSYLSGRTNERPFPFGQLTPLGKFTE